VQDYPALGNIIAFTDGIFDETLWQTESWHFGYQFAAHHLDDPEDSYLLVRRGISENDVAARIKEQIEEDKLFWAERYREPRVHTLAFSSPEAKEALEFVAPFKNGVFAQSLAPYASSPYITFRRYINGCKTEETVTIDLESETVTYSDIRYTKEDMAQMENISAQLALKAEEYSKKLPKPPHMDPSGKQLLHLWMEARYHKIDGKLYGVIQTFWEYGYEHDYYKDFHDYSYTLYDMSKSTAVIIEPEKLAKIIGENNVALIRYGEDIHEGVG